MFIIVAKKALLIWLPLYDNIGSISKQIQPYYRLVRFRFRVRNTYFLLHLDSSQVPCPWYLYQMLTQKQVRTYRRNLCYLISLKHLMRSRTVTNRIYSPKRPLFLLACAKFSELPSNISTLSRIPGQFSDSYCQRIIQGRSFCRSSDPDRD